MQQLLRNTLMCSVLAVLTAGSVSAQLFCFTSGPGATLNCYERVVTDSPILWADANAAANARSLVSAPGHLAVITSAEEQDYLTTFAAVPSLYLYFVTANSPAAIAGDYTSGRALFGPQLEDTGPVTADVVLVEDGVGATNDACEPLTPASAAAVSGNIALIDRGACFFTTKIVQAQTAGAVGVIIANNQPNGVINMAAGTADVITIPALMISLDDGNLFKANMPVNATMRAEFNPFAQPSRPFIGGECIGGQCDDASDFTWVTGEPNTFTNWCGGEPSGDPAGVLHLFAPDGCWNDTIGDQPFWNSYLVEYECGPSDSDGDGLGDLCDEGIPPVCEMASIDPGPPVTLRIRIQDTQSGFGGISVVRNENVELLLESGTFAAGNRDEIIIAASKVDPTAKSVVVFEVTDLAGNMTRCDPVITTLSQEVPEAYALEQNYPNPFNPTTTINFRVPEEGHVSLRVYDVMGREVIALVDESMAAGTYQVEWDSRDDGGHEVASGVYLYRMEAGAFTTVRRMVLLK